MCLLMYSCHDLAYLYTCSQCTMYFSLYIIVPSYVHVINFVLLLNQIIDMVNLMCLFTFDHDSYFWLDCYLL